MQISSETLAQLKNYATINPNILFRAGNVISTISTGKNIFAQATVAEDFPVEFGVYDLPSLLALLTLADGQEVDFGDKSLKVTKGDGEFQYYYSDPAIIVAPPQKNIVVDEHFVFEITKEDLVMIIKAASIIGAPTMSIIGNGKNVTGSRYYWN